MRLVSLSLCAVLAVSGCARLAESRLNPLTWFPRLTETRAAAPALREPLVTAPRAQVVDARPLVAEMIELRIEPASEGAIVRATGLALGSGAFNAQLTREGLEGGVLVYAMRAEYPAESGPAPAQQRQITAAAQLDARELSALRGVRVLAQGNALTASR